MSQEDNILLEFRQELKDNVTVFTANVLAIEYDFSNIYLVNELGRIAHNLKGASAILGFTRMSHLFHKVENIFDDVRSGRIELNKIITTALFGFVDLVEELSEYLGEEGELYSDEQLQKISDMEDKLDQLTKAAIPDFIQAAEQEVHFSDDELAPLFAELSSLPEDNLEKISISMKILLSKLANALASPNRVEMLVNLLNEAEQLASQYNLLNLGNSIDSYKLDFTTQEKAPSLINSLSGLLNTLLDHIHSLYQVDTIEELFLGTEAEEAREDISRAALRFTKADLERLKEEVSHVDPDLFVILQREYTELRDNLKDSFEKNDKHSLLANLKLFAGTAGMFELSLIRQKAGELELLAADGRVIASDAFDELIVIINLLISPENIDSYIKELASIPPPVPVIPVAEPVIEEDAPPVVIFPEEVVPVAPVVVSPQPGIMARNPFQVAQKPPEEVKKEEGATSVPITKLRDYKITGSHTNLSVFRAVDEALTTPEEEAEGVVVPEIPDEIFDESIESDIDSIIHEPEPPAPHVEPEAAPSLSALIEGYEGEQPPLSPLSEPLPEGTRIIRSQAFKDECASIDPDLAPDFLVEFMGYRDELKQLLASYLYDSQNETLTRISKIGHTIKGSCGMAGLTHISHQGGIVEKLVQDHLGLTHNTREITLLVDMLNALEGILSPDKAVEVESTPAIEYHEDEPKYIPAYQLLLQQENIDISDIIDYTKQPNEEAKPAIQETVKFDSVKADTELENIFENIGHTATQPPVVPIAPRTFGIQRQPPVQPAAQPTGIEGIIQQPTQVQSVAGIEGIIQQARPAATRPTGIEGLIEQAPVAAQTTRFVQSVKAEDRFIRLDIAKVDELLNFISSLYTIQTGLSNNMDQYMQMLTDINTSIYRLKELQVALDEEYSLMLETASPQKTSAAGGEFSELEMDKYTSMYRWTRELHESSEDIFVFADTLRRRLHKTEDLISSLLNVTNDLQYTTLKTRMGSLKPLSIKFTRYIRDLGQQQNKNINFTFFGDTLEIDKSIINQIEDSLLHMIKNSLDHGIESVDERTRMGKPPQAQLKIEVFPQTDLIKIVVSDDGRGLSMQGIKNKAEQIGISTAKMTDQDLINLIFMHGFSTAREVSEISGRGIGMDVVKSTVDKLHGTIKVDTEEGHGTRFEISLPNNIFTLKAMVFHIFDETYGMPYNNVVQTVGLSREKISKKEDNKYYFQFRDGEIEILDVIKLFFEKPFSPEMNKLTHGIVVNLDKVNYLIPTGQIVGLQNIQTKALNPPIDRSLLYSAASIDASGNVFMVLNIDEARNRLDAARAGAQPGGIGTRATSYFTAAHKKEKKEETANTILIVDDSLSIRNIVSKVVGKAGYTVLTAKDGVEGLEIIRANGAANISGIILDVEMPRMTGYEMLTELRADPAISDIPVMMLTSRAGEKHKQKAIELGADGYIAKPYKEEEFISIVRTVTAKRHAGKTGELVEI